MLLIAAAGFDLQTAFKYLSSLEEHRVAGYQVKGIQAIKRPTRMASVSFIPVIAAGRKIIVPCPGAPRLFLRYPRPTYRHRDHTDI